MRKSKGAALTKSGFQVRIGANVKSRLKYTAAHGEFLTKTGSRAQIGIYGFLGKQITVQTKMLSFAKE